MYTVNTNIIQTCSSIRILSLKTNAIVNNNFTFIAKVVHSMNNTDKETRQEEKREHGRSRKQDKDESFWVLIILWNYINKSSFASLKWKHRRRKCSQMNVLNRKTQTYKIHIKVTMTLKKECRRISTIHPSNPTRKTWQQWQILQ